MTLPRYERPRESNAGTTDLLPQTVIPYDQATAALASSSLSPGSRALLLGLLKTGTTRVFPGGGIGIEYGSLLKTAVRPDDLGRHVREVSEHLMAKRVELLLVPGMSGYPVGAMYSLAANIPALLLKKQRLSPDAGADFPPGSFAIPSYTGEGDVVMSADLEAARHIVSEIVDRQLASQMHAPAAEIAVHCAGADDIIDKATMAHAITESAPRFCAEPLADAIAAHRARTGDDRPITCRVEVVAWVTPLIKSYNGPREHLKRTFGIEPFAGLSVLGVHLNPPALEIEGIGAVAFASNK